ncbi:hypothetical protein E2C01_088450 [Portunus trituberculatus]|uniref:Uncharacterized protein n=1 Tax=Portunus trituberculatus TaxID=210409 RepID=A0A5B7JGM3_PORTR|nr:hypothetical protein [Portunus trituberculatus]
MKRRSPSQHARLAGPTHPLELAVKEVATVVASADCAASHPLLSLAASTSDKSIFRSPTPPDDPRSGCLSSFDPDVRVRLQGTCSR